jgi:nucleotide-binding universal stress UspA family protein
MSAWIVVVAAVAVAAGLAAGWWLSRRGPRPAHRRDRVRGTDDVRRILLPFTGTTISKRAFDAAVRLARVEDAVLIPCYLAEVPLTLPLETPLPNACRSALPLLETIEQRAAALGVPVDARVVRGRTYRDALRRALDEEHYDRVIVSATSNEREGFTSDDLVWLLQRADAEVLILRPAPEDHRAVAPEPVGHF